ncbi:lamin tail domain-containing protein [Tenuifilum sp.]|uniref:lamin tail domain-containing protein n=4 Tax=Tenuifilum sp. TaxID=2760880 RepID=UPI002BE1C216|nr:lamin tail domain-containing protein [Tenuifilum sp.]
MRVTVITFLTLLASLTFGQQVVTFNFESGDLSEWSQKPENRWSISTNSPLSGSASLRHSFDNSIAYTDTIYRALPVWDIEKGDVTWRFLIRHGYDPSASNSWWVYLMANDEIANSNESGYAVGVNLTGSDDLLKLWRIDNGSAQVILTSTLNWQTQIGTGKAGAIEVTRTFDGNFTLRASVSGNFSTLTTHGTVYDFSYKNFNIFGIGYRYSSAQDMKLWADDISFIYQPINPNDRTTAVLNPSQQVVPTNIISTSTLEENCVDVLRFRITDAGSGDGLPTYVKRMTIKNPDPENASWSSLLGGITLKKDGQLIPTQTVSITDQQVTIEVDSSLATVPDGQYTEFTFGVYLKDSNIPDNLNLLFEIDNENHGFQSSLWGSGFAQTFPAKVQSGIFTIRVNATQAMFRNISPIAIIGKPFGLEVAATDTNSNTDADYGGQITLSLSEGNGSLSSVNGLSRVAIQGIAKWDSLLYDRYGSIRIMAAGENINTDISDEIVIGYDTTSYAAVPGNQVSSFDISSMATSPSQANELMRFRITDAGSDGAPTHLMKIRLNRANTVNAATLNKAIEGVMVKLGDNYISFSSVDIKTSTIDITFPPGALTIPDGQTIELGIWVYLKNSGISDNQTIQLYIDKLNPGFEAYDIGSRFATKFPTNINSAIATIRVSATKLNFTSTPTRVGVNEPFTVKVKPTDANGNADVNFAGNVELLLGSGSGELELISENPAPIINGETQLEANYSTPGIFTLIARNPSLNDAVSGNITSGDADGFAAPLIQPTDTVIFTQNNSYAAAAQEIIRFKLKDPGSTDGLPLNVSRIKLLAFNPSSLPELARMVQGFVLDNGTITIAPKSYTFSGNVLQIDFNEGDVVVNDTDSANFILKVFLKDRNLVDAFRFQFYIPSSNHGWTAFDNSTAFNSTFPSTIYGRPCRIEVQADRLKFLTQPFGVNPNEPFSVSVMACDSRGNVDREFQAYAALEVYNGTGSLIVNPLLQPLNNGIATWNGVKLTATGTYRLKSYFGWLADAISENIYCGYNHTCPVSEYFESILPAWSGIENWTTSRTDPITGEYSLAHAGDPAANQSVLSIPIETTLLGKASEWNITIRNGNWDPSSENFFYLAFASTHENPMDTEAEGYAVGINPSSGNDNIAVWQFKEGKRTNIIQSAFDWNENDQVKITVTLSPNGTIKLWFTPKSTGLKIFGGEAKIAVPQCSYMAFVFAYTASRAGQLWIDDMSLCTTDFAPVISSARASNLNTVRVNFSKPVSIQSAQNVQNYKLKTLTNQNIGIQSIRIDGNQMVSITTQKLPFEKLILVVRNIEDMNGYSLPDSIELGFTAQGNMGRLIFNEIMANPVPSNGLPEYEYIELFNPGTDTVFTEGWKLTLNEKTVTMPADTIPPKSYALVGGTTAMSNFNVYGKTIAITSFPALLNDGMLLRLYDQQENLIGFANYTKEWYNDSIRNVGGYSLECIDYSNLAEGKNNWRASIASEGGTPCAPNSVMAINPDVTPPQLCYIEVPDAKTIRLCFSEAMDSLTATIHENYITELGINNINIGELYTRVTIELSEPLEAEKIYEISISGLTDFAGNAMPDTAIRVGLPQLASEGDIVINEILFNPYVGGTDFVELFNRSSKCFDLSQIKIANRNETDLSLKDPDSASPLPWLFFPGDYAVITTNPNQVTQFYSCQNPSSFIKTSRLAAFNNDKGYVVLLNSENEVIDELRYTEKMHNKLLNDFKGVSLERINPSMPTNQSSTWQSAAQAAGFATPTYRNSQYSELSGEKSNFSLTPETFSPDGDGRDDYLLISYQLPEPGYVANIRVFNANGIEIYRLANNMTLGTSGQLRWDGTDTKNRRVNSGIYIVYFEYFNLSGEVKREKKTCVVGYR